MQFRDGQAGSVHRDRAFESGVAGELTRQCDFQPRVRSLFGDGHDLRGAVDMTLDEVAAKPPVDAQGPLEIDRGARFQVAQSGPIETLLEQVEHDLFFAVCCHGQATPVDRHTLADADAVSRARGIDQQLHRTVRASQPPDFPDFADQTGKHRKKLPRFFPRTERNPQQ